MTKTYIEFSFAGSFFSESFISEVTNRQISKEEIPKRAFGYKFFDVEEVEIDGEKLTGKRKNESPQYLIGKFYTYDEVKKMFENDDSKRILISNLSQYKGGVLTRIGNWQPFYEDTIVVAE